MSLVLFSIVEAREPDHLDLDVFSARSSLTACFTRSAIAASASARYERGS
jgi:hypothetical protein